MTSFNNNDITTIIWKKNYAHHSIYVDMTQNYPEDYISILPASKPVRNIATLIKQFIRRSQPFNSARAYDIKKVAFTLVYLNLSLGDIGC